MPIIATIKTFPVPRPTPEKPTKRRNLLRWREARIRRLRFELRGSRIEPERQMLIAARLVQLTKPLN